MGYIACFSGGSQPAPVATSFRFLKWHIMNIKGSNGYVQMSRIDFLDDNNNEYAFDSGVQGVVNNGSIVDGSVANILNDQTNNKLCVSWNNTYVDIILDLGVGHELDTTTYTKFTWYTANDEPNRDPASWILYGANYATFEDEVLLNQELGFQATSTRMTLAYTGDVAANTNWHREDPHFYDSLVLNGSMNFVTPYTVNSDYAIYCDFTTNSYTSNQAVIGNNVNSDYIHLTQFNNKWYHPVGPGTEGSFTDSLTGRHTILFDDTGVYFDSVLKSSFTPSTDASANLIIAGRPVGYATNLTGKIHEYKITSISTGDVIADYKPAFYMDQIGLYETVNKQFLLAGTGTYLETPIVS